MDTLRKSIRRKKRTAGEITLETFIQILFWAILIIITYKIYNSIVESYLSKPHQGTIQSLDRLKIEVNNMVKDSVTAPIFVDAKHQINGFKSFNNPRVCSAGKSCICICSINTNCENNALKQCNALDVTLNKDFVLLPKKDNGGKEVTFNCNINKMQDKTVDVSC